MKRQAESRLVTGGLTDTTVKNMTLDMKMGKKRKEKKMFLARSAMRD